MLQEKETPAQSSLTCRELRFHSKPVSKFSIISTSLSSEYPTYTFISIELAWQQLLMNHFFVLHVYGILIS